MNPRDIKPGQSFWMVRDRHGRDPIAEPVSVKSVGRRWAKLNNGYQFDLSSPDWRELDGDGYDSPGYLWDSREVFQAARLRVKLLAAIREKFKHYSIRRTDPPLQNVLEAARLLGLEFNEAELLRNQEMSIQDA